MNDMLSGIDLSKLGPISLVILALLGLVFWFVRDVIRTHHETIRHLIGKNEKV